MQPDIAAPRPSSPPFSLEGDLAATLPAPVRKKFKALRERAERERAQHLSISEKRQGFLSSIPQLKEKIEAMTLPLNNDTRQFPGRGLDENSPEVAAARMQLASMQEDLDGLNAFYSNPNNGQLGALVASLESYINRRGRSVFEIVQVAAPALQKGQSLASAIEARRRRLRELDADLKSAETAPWPSSITKKLAREQLARLSERGRPDVFALVERCEPIGWPLLPMTSASLDQRQGLVVPTMALTELMRVDTAGLIAWAIGPMLLAGIDREIDELSDDKKALTAEQRKERKDQILADKLDTEREEESLIELAEKDGVQVPRRSDADPRAVLGIGR